jgi:NADPH-dependent 2,4-dienoyl-CoA reductase/sulfur reductase-like enzyme
MRLRLDTTARGIDTAGHKLLVTGPDGAEDLIAYDQLVIGTGAVPARPPIAGLATLGPGDGVHLLHSMGDTFSLMSTLTETSPASAVIVGAGYIGLEMADALTTRGLAVTQIEQLPEVLPTVDPQLGALVHAELAARGVEILAGTAVRSVGKAAPGAPGRLQVEAVTSAGEPVTPAAVCCSASSASFAAAAVRPGSFGMNSLNCRSSSQVPMYTFQPTIMVFTRSPLRSGREAAVLAGACVVMSVTVLGSP